MLKKVIEQNLNKKHQVQFYTFNFRKSTMASVSNLPALFNIKNQHSVSVHRSLCFSFPFFSVAYSFFCCMNTFG